MNQAFIIVHADKSVMRISGIQVKGLNTQKLERILTNKLQALVRVIGVTGSEIEMDVYDIEPDHVIRNEKGLIEVLSLAEGITASDVTKISCSEKIVEVEFDRIPDQPISACAREKWMRGPFDASRGTV